ncbi:MAG: DUF58 domain-containing protein [Elusimicrobiota bacterium]
MIPREVMNQIRKIEIRTKRLVNDTFAGQYSSVFKGHGMEFSDVREYQPGDDIRSIDWNVTARFGHPYIKKFVEERELTLIFLVDMSGSTDFGTKLKTKAAVAAEITAALSFSAVRNNDKVGLLVFTDKIEKYIPPKKSRAHILRLIREILFYKPQSTGTNIRQALEYINDVQKRKSIIFLISDFNDDGFEKALKVTSYRHDVIAIRIFDEKEESIPSIGNIELKDNESGEVLVINTNDAVLMSKFKEKKDNRAAYIKDLFKTAEVDVIPLNAGESYVKPLLNFFKVRERRYR